MPIVEYRGKKITLPDDMSEADINNAMPSIADQIDSDLSVVEAPNSKKERTALGTIKDLGISALKSAISLPETAIGLADLAQKYSMPNIARRLVTGTESPSLGKTLEDVGVRFSDAKNIANDYKSDAQKLADAEFQNADGFVDSSIAAINNPSVIVNAGVESIAPMLSGGVVSRGILNAAPKIGTVIGGAIGEGVVGAGSSAEGTRQETKDGQLSDKQAALSVASGAGTALFGAAGGKIAQKFGIGDIDTVIAGGATTSSNKNFARKLIEGGITEGVFEELPQSVQEQMFSNWSLDKPITDGVDKAAAMGLLTGGAMGAGAQLIPSRNLSAGQDALSVDGNVADDVVAAQLQEEYETKQKSAESQAALENITLPETSVDEAIELAKIAIDAPIAKPTGLLASLPINDQAINAADILGDSNVSTANDGLASVVEIATEGASDNLQGSLGDILNKPAGGFNSGPVYNPAETLTQGSGSGLDDGIGSQPDNALSIEKVDIDSSGQPYVEEVSVAGEAIDNDWVAFNPDTGTLNIPRAEMPQIKTVHRGAMVNFLNARGIEQLQETVPAASLKPTQQEFSTSKVQKAIDFKDGNRSILVSSDNHVLDGHHQWLAKLNGNEDIDVIRLNAPITQLLETVKEFPSATNSDGVILAENVKTAEAAPILAAVSPIESNGLIEVAKIGGKNSKESISVKQSGDKLAVLHNGEPLIDFDTEQDVTVPLNATIADIKKAVKASGQFNKQILSFNKEYAGVNPTTANTVDIAKPIEAPVSKRTQINEKFEQNKDVLRAWMPDMDWATIGGRIIRDDDNQVSGRTTWEPKDYNLDAIRKGSGLSYPGMQKAVQKAPDGKPLSKVENAAIDAMIELAETIKNSNQTETELDDNPFLTIEEEDALAQLESDMNWMALLEQSASDDNILASISSQAQNYQDAFNNDIGEYLEQIAEYERQEQRTVSETDPSEPQESAGRNERARENESNADTESQKQSETSGEPATKKLDLLGDDTAGKQAIADAERTKDAKRNSGTDNQDNFTLTGSNSEADIAAAAGAQDLFSQPEEKTTTKDKKQESKPVDSKPKSPLDSYDNAMDEYSKGISNAEDYKAAFNEVLANEQIIKEYLEANFTKQQLFERGGRQLESRYKSEKKTRVVSALYSDMVSNFLLPNENGMTSYSADFGDDKYKNIKSQVEEITQSSLDKAMDRQQQAINKNKEAQAERVQGMDDPKTLDDYTNVLRAKMSDGKTLKEARLSLTPEQREIYDSLYADRTMADRTDRKETQKSNIQTAGQTVEGNIIETKHTKKGHDLFVVQLSERVSKDDYTTLNTGAKNLGGYYSSFRGAGAIPGFQFTSKENAQAFVQLGGGDNTAAKEQAKDRRNAFDDDKSQSAVERLTEMAARLEDKADEDLGRDRKSNTHRRASMAARAEAQASAQKAMAITMRNIANAIQNGETKYLSKVRQKVQVELLQGMTNTAQYNKLRGKYPAYSDYEKHQGEPANKETVDYSEFPSYTAYRSDLASLGRSMIEVDGLKILGNRILSVADDVTNAYLKFAKDNIDKVSNYRGADGARAVFSSKALAEQSIARSGFNGKAIVLPFKRGENLIIDSPSASKERGVWAGDDDKQITLSAEFGKELVEKLGKANRKVNRVRLPWQFENAYDKREKLSRMGIENAAEMRAALREFVSLKEEAKQPDIIKQLERAMIGRKNDGLDFFPTPANTSDEMIEAADIQEGMNVLEPSAGMGHIAERIREAGFEPDVVEFSGDRRELLETKGFNVVGSDFLGVTEKYDRIIMNPPFSNRRDEEHVRHAYNLLKPNGKVVAIMGEGVFFGSDKRATEFRDWLESVGGTSEKLEEGTFKDASLPVNTGVNARMVVIEKGDSGTALFSRSKSQTDTPEFKKWFGDSKVVDADDGKPLVVYHGTQSDFDTFDGGAFFTDDYMNADGYAGGENVMEVFIRIENPLIIDAKGKKWDELNNEYGNTTQQIISKLDAIKYDGVIFNNIQDSWIDDEDYQDAGTVYYVASPNQIKSAIGNNGNFDESNPDIRFSKADTSGGMTKADVEKSVNALRANWKNAPQIIVVDDMNDLAIREAVRAENDRQLSQGATGQPEGFFDAGKVYIVASEMNSTDDVARVVMHETLGHYGLRGVFGKDLAKVLENITIMRRKELNAKAKQYGLDTSKASDRLIAAEEVLAEMAQTNPQLGFVQRAIAAIRTWLRDNGFKMKLTDNDIVANYLMPARAYVQRGGKEQSTGDMVAAFNRTNRTPSKGAGDTHLTAFMEAIAQNKDLFEYQAIDSKNINDIAKAIDIGYEVKPLGASQTKIKNATKAWEVSVPNATHRSGVIYENGNDVWIDVSRLISGNDRGSAIYAIAADYAHNNGKVLIGDPEGLSRKALYRRNENMLSSALKHGTTKHLMPHIAQEVPSEYYQGHEAEFGKSVRALDWIEGNDVHNIKEMLYNSYDSAIKNIPEVKDVIYNTESGKFEHTDGRPFTTQDSERVSTRIANEPNNPYRAGSGTIKRSALINTFLRKESAGRRGELLGEAVNQLHGNGLSPDLKGVMYSRSNQNQSNLTPQWDSPEASKIDSILYALQDKHIDLKHVTQAIKKAGNDISDRWNAYLQEELYHGRTAKRTQDFIKDDLEPLIEDMRMRGVSMADFEEYLWMRHAEERNVQIAKVNADMPDGGSGVSTADAQDYLENLPASNKSKYESLAKRIDLINRKSRQVLIDYGIESADTIAAWEGAYKNYVPLMREDMDAGFGNGTGQGFSVKGNSSKRATGSKRAVVDIIANIAQQYEKNITRGEKNRVATALIGLATLNPNEDVWQVDTPLTITDVNKATGLVETRTDPNYKSRNNVVVARIRNKLGKIEERSVVFNQFDERAMRMAESIKNLDMDQLNAGLIFMGSITRYFSSINTQYNPIFGVVNITRDVQGAMLNLTTTELAGKQKEVLKNVMPAMRGIYRDLRSIRKGNQPANTEWAQLWEEYQNEGGATGFKDMYANAGERTEALAKALDPEWWTKTLAGKVVSINGILTVPETALKDKAIKPVFDWLSDYNQTLENAVRLSAYKVALDNGISKQQAASLGKNLTVNFNRKGSIGRTAGSLYAFFNAAVQGTARIGETLTGPKGKQIIAGGVAVGVMQAIVLAAMGFDEEEPPEFVRSTNLIIPTGNKSYVTIPMPLGFNVFPNLGRISAEWAINGMENTTERVFDLFGALMDSFNPLGGNGRIDSIIMPTAFDPFNDLSKNKDHTGRSIAQEDFSSLDPTPGYTRTRDKATAISIELARWINNLSGGDDYEQGQLSPTGDQIEYLIGQVTGGVGRELVKTAATIETIVTGEDLPTYKIPLVGRFIGNSKGQAPQAGKFYNNLTRINKLENGLIGRDRDGKDVDTFINENPEVNYIDYGKKAYSAIRKLRQYKRELVEQDANRNEVKLVDEEITMIMTEFNDTVANAKVEQSP